MSELALIALAVFFVIANGFFVAAEFAIVKVRSTQLEEVEARAGRRGAAARHILTHLDRYLSATQLGITLASLALGWIGEPAFARLVEKPLSSAGIASPAIVHGIAFALAFSIISLLHIVLGELAPKRIAIRNALPTALWTAIPLRIFFKIAYPAIWVLNVCANRLLVALGFPAVSEVGELHSEEEIRLLLEESAERGEIPHHRRDLLEGIFDFTRRTARQIMIPRTDVVYLSTTHSVEENLAVVRKTRHTRFPLCDGDLDHTIGMIHVKDLLLRAPEDDIRDLRSLRREMLFVPESLPIERLMADFRAKRIHMAIVVDEYGGGAGVVTLENVLEELVGQIDDEFDLDRPEFERLADGGCRARGDLLLEDLAQRLDAPIGETEAETVGGYVLERLARKPKIGDEVEVAGRRAVVEEAREFRVQWVRVLPDEKKRGGTESE